jgi:16S rRNA (cytosine967-C5)-methyltransferase
MQQKPSSNIHIRRPRACSPPAEAGIESRRLALEILIRVDWDGAFADVLLGAHLGNLRNPADRRLVTQLVLGTIAWRGQLDYELARLSSRPLNTIDPPILTLLRLGLYQVRVLTRVPIHAVVDTAVELARKSLRDDRACGFVNAILRAATRAASSLPDRSRDEIEYLSVRYSHPRWLVDKFRSWLGIEQAVAFMAANNQPAPNAIRLNLSRGAAPELIKQIERDGMKVARHGLLPETIILDCPASFDAASYRDGVFASQSEASQLIVGLLAPPRGATVLDCAAAPGGKSAHLAELVGGAGRVIAVDRKRGGLRQARAVAARLGHHNIDFIRGDLAKALPLRARSFNYVLLDAPCSGLGTLREHPEIRWRLTKDDLMRMSQTQQKMLNQVAELVASDGALVYSVCSPAPEEGKDLIQTFLESHLEFQIADRREWRAGQDHEPPMLIEDRVNRTGFFAARLRRR